ncbi:MAG: putative S-layer protein [Nanoarchaeota archaeon]|nr:putative S-layer protein [Nanoarchaeota archaeon]
MNKKILTLMIASLLVLVAVVNFSSATEIKNVNPSELTFDGTSFTFDVEFTENGTYTLDVEDLVEGTQTVEFSLILATSTIEIMEINDTVTSVTKTFNVEYNASDFIFRFGRDYSTNVIVYNHTDNSVVDQEIIKFEEVNYCETIPNVLGYLDLDVEINTLNGFGDDESYWYPYDEIEVEVKVDNNYNWDVRNIEIEWALYSTNGKKIKDDTLSDFKLKDGDDKTVTFTFKLDEDIDEFEGEDAVLYVKATGKIDDNNAGVYDNEETCYSQNIETDVRADENFVILTNFKINEAEVKDLVFEDSAFSCEQELTITADAWNIGDSNQDNVEIHVYNSELGISETIDAGDIDSYDNSEISFTFSIPEGAKEKWHYLRFDIYDEDNDIFQNSEDDEASFDLRFEVEGCLVLVEPTINAALISEIAKEGKEIVIGFTVTNPSEKTVSYVLNAAGYSEWATMVNFEGNSFELAPGESKEVRLNLEAKKDSAGERMFNLEVLSEGKMVSTQPVAVLIEEGRWNFGDFMRDNWKIVGIALLNLILVIAIIVVAVRTYRR